MEGELWPVIDLRPLTGSIGAEIFGVDLSNNLDTSTVARLRQELLTHLVIFFRDQSLDAEQQKNFARQFGELYVHPYLVVGDDPTVIEIKRKSGDKRVTGDHWHSDATIDSEPPLGSILYGIKIPPYGGDTLFSNQYLAYESLSETMQRRELVLGNRTGC